MLALARVAPQPSRVCAAPHYGVPHHSRRACPRALVRAARMPPYAPYSDAPLSAPVARRGSSGHCHERHAQPQGSQRPLADSLEARQSKRSSWQTLVRACMGPVGVWHLLCRAPNAQTPSPPHGGAGAPCRVAPGILPESSGGGWTRWQVAMCAISVVICYADRWVVPPTLLPVHRWFRTWGVQSGACERPEAFHDSPVWVQPSSYHSVR